MAGFDLHRLELLLARGHAGDAESHCRAALARNPADGVAWYGLAQTMESLDRPADRIDALEKAVRYLGEQPPLLGRLADACLDAGRLKDARRLYRKLAGAMPDNPLPLVRLADVLSRLGNRDAAFLELRKRLAKSPGQIDLHGAINRLLLEDGQGAEAVRRMRALVEKQPEAATLWVNFGHALKNTGKLDEAAVAYRRALDAKPLIGEAYRHLVRLTMATDLDALDARMAALFGDSAIDPPDRAEIGFGLFHRYDQIGACKQAWTVLNSANATMSGLKPFRGERDTARAALIRATVTADYIETRRAAPTDRRPIFIVGLPRTGSTLVEQILASHPDVAPAGESPAFDNAVAAVLKERTGTSDPRGLDDLNAAGIEAIRRRYWEATAPMRGAAPRHTDKQLANIQNVGLIRLAFPDAAIVLCERDDSESLFSSYGMAFSIGQNHTYNLDDLITCYRAYRETVAHWRRELGDCFVTIRYESLVGDFEAECRRLSAECGLSWSEAVLSFHEQKNVVRTASAPQVRRKLYSSSLKRSEPYRQWLAPWLDKLG